MSHSVEVNLMGRSFTIRTEDDPERVLAAASMVQERVDDLRQTGSTVASDRLLMLVALNLAGELLQKESVAVEGIDSLISALDEVVSQAEGLAKAPLR
ncbi:MAG TPA: cell division protein ZapA [Mariprofundaceae bacterium]|nr:cell division protein ZapA [Mariprofundaceae bacterium]